MVVLLRTGQLEVDLTGALQRSINQAPAICRTVRDVETPLQTVGQLLIQQRSNGSLTVTDLTSGSVLGALTLPTDTAGTTRPSAYPGRTALGSQSPRATTSRVSTRSWRWWTCRLTAGSIACASAGRNLTAGEWRQYVGASLPATCRLRPIGSGARQAVRRPGFSASYQRANRLPRGRLGWANLYVAEPSATCSSGTWAWRGRPVLLRLSELRVIVDDRGQLQHFPFQVRILTTRTPAWWCRRCTGPCHNVLMITAGCRTPSSALTTPAPVGRARPSRLRRLIQPHHRRGEGAVASAAISAGCVRAASSPHFRVTGPCIRLWVTRCPARGAWRYAVGWLVGGDRCLRVADPCQARQGRSR